MATVFSRNGTWYADFQDVTRTPSRRKISLRTRDKSVARLRLAELEKDAAYGLFDPFTDNPFSYKKQHKKSLTVELALEQFLETKRRADLSKNTIDLYRYDLGTLAKQVGAQTPLERLTARQLEAFVREPSIATTTQHKRHRIADIFLRWCVEEDYLQENPITKIARPKKLHRLPKVIRPEELERICMALRSDYERLLKKYNGVKEGDLIWMIPLFRFALYTGMRVSELARLRWEHIDFCTRLISIHKQKNKKAQTIPLNAKAAEVLKAVPKDKLNDYVFKSPRATGTQRSTKAFRIRVNAAFVKYRGVAGIKKPLTFHSHRHGFCTLLAEAGKSAIVIMEAARHANIETSMIYVSISNEHLKAELDDVFS